MIRNKIFWSVLITMAIVFIFARAVLQRRASAMDTYRSARVKKGSLQIMVMTTGTVQPQNRLEIKPPIAGRVEEALVEEGMPVHQGQVLAWMSSTERAALLDAARAQGTNELAYWEELYKPTPLVAPLNGNIIARNIEPGQTVTAAEALYVLADRLIIEAPVDETDIGQISVGQSAELTLDAYPEDVIWGLVDKIAYEARTVNNVTIYAVDFLPLSLPPFLRSGMTANIKVVTASTNDVLLVPTEAVGLESNQPIVWRDRPGPSAKPLAVPVIIGLNDGRLTEIKSGLQEGDSVLIKQASSSSKNNTNQRNPFTPLGGRRR